MEWVAMWAHQRTEGTLLYQSEFPQGTMLIRPIGHTQNRSLLLLQWAGIYKDCVFHSTLPFRASSYSTQPSTGAGWSYLKSKFALKVESFVNVFASKRQISIFFYLLELLHHQHNHQNPTIDTTDALFSISPPLSLIPLSSEQSSLPSLERLTARPESIITRSPLDPISRLVTVYGPRTQPVNHQI